MKLISLIVPLTVWADEETTFNFDPSLESYSTEVERYLSQFGAAVTEDPVFLESMEPSIPAVNDRVRGLSDSARPAVTRPDPIRALRQLKLMVVGMMDPKISEAAMGSGFGRYCYYGCHCLPDKDHADMKVFGKPVDNIDVTCRDFGTCYKCINYKYNNQCIPERTQYRFRIRISKRTGNREISCKMNPVDTCERDTCECDKFFSSTVSKFEQEWQEKYHITRGGFERNQGCRAPKPVALVSSGSVIDMTHTLQTGTGGGNDGFFHSFLGNTIEEFDPLPTSDWEMGQNVFFDGFESNPDGPTFVKPPVVQSCCGLNDFPNVTLKKSSDECCGKHPYNPDIHQCCANNDIKYGGEMCD